MVHKVWRFGTGNHCKLMGGPGVRFPYALAKASNVVLIGSEPQLGSTIRICALGGA
jgi:hypothetical protein